MDIDTFLTNKEQMEKKSIEEQKAFYENLMETEKAYSLVQLQAYFQYAMLFYQDGDFRKTREILEPVMINYQSYTDIPELISCFHLMGVACHCEAEYHLARYFSEKALEIATVHNKKNYFSYEYNNIALTYIIQEDYTKALHYIMLAKEHLADSDEQMGAYVYLNMTNIYLNLNCLDDALEAYHLLLDRYDGNQYLPDDIRLCAVSLFYKLGDKEKYEACKNQALQNLDQLYAAEYIDSCKVLFNCGLDSEDYELVQRILDSMDQYLVHHPQELRVGVKVEELKYQFAQKRNDLQAMLTAIEKKTFYKQQIIRISEKQRAQSYEKFMKINQDLQKAVESKEKANQVKTQFLSNMSHDMRTPINGIMGMLNIISRNREDAARVDDCLNKIQLSAEHLLSLINDVLDMTKLETDSIVLENEPFNLDQICGETMDIVTFQATEAGLHVHAEHDDVQGLHLLGSPLYLKKILINLFTNSIKYNKPGGHIYTSLRVLSQTSDSVTCQFQIRDTGIGMSEEFIQQKLFMPFVQERSTARSTYSGSGLGMSIVEQLIRKLGGTIEVTSRLGEGSCFTITLPFEIDKSPAASVQPMLSPASLKGMKLLVVEDNELNMEIAEFLLTEEGAILDKAFNGQEAVQLYQQANPGTYDAVLMDLMMPVMDGYEATRQIRSSSNPDARTIPIIAMSAKAFTEDIQASLDAGMNAHLTKPLFRDQLVAALLKHKLS